MGAVLLKAILADASGLQVNDLAMRRGELRLFVVHYAQNAGGGGSRPHFDLGGYHGRRVADDLVTSGVNLRAAFEKAACGFNLRLRRNNRRTLPL
jgi:hypothetical protein